MKKYIAVVFALIIILTGTSACKNNPKPSSDNQSADVQTRRSKRVPENDSSAPEALGPNIIDKTKEYSEYMQSRIDMPKRDVLAE